MITASTNDPYCSDGFCEKCKQWYCVIQFDKEKCRNGICTKCNTFMKLAYRRLIIDDKPLVCAYCGRDPVYIEREPGVSIFTIERDKQGDMKVNRHPCDLEWEAKKLLKAEIQS